MRNKYWIWIVCPQGSSAIIYAGLGRKKDIQERWYSLTKVDREVPLEIHYRGNKYGSGRGYKAIKFLCYNTYDWKPDCIAKMRMLAQQNKWLLVEDLTGDTPERII